MSESYKFPSVNAGRLGEKERENGRQEARGEREGQKKSTKALLIYLTLP